MVREPVLVLTRPADLDERLPTGPALLRLPLLALHPATPDPHLDAQLAAASRADLLVFVSGAAASSAFALAPQLRLNRRARWCAVGPATARRVRALFDVDVMAPTSDSANSEGLLAALGDVVGCQCTIFAAPDGRDLLADTLRERGAMVAVVEVYRRRRAAVAGADLRRLQAMRDALVFTATSVAVLDALDDLLQRLDWPLAPIRLLVSAPRIAEAAAGRGFRHVLVARSASVADLVAALQSSPWVG